LGNKIKDTDYLYLTAYIRTKEVSLLNHGQIQRMLDAETPADAARVLEECGYGDMADFTMDSLEQRLSKRRADMMKDLASVAPDTAIVDVFRIRYDYHNAKVLIKSEAMNVDAQRLLSQAGRILPDELSESYYQESFSSVPDILASAMVEAKEVLARTGDPQLSDFVLDRAYFKEFAELAKNTGSEFFEGYVRLSIDSANLRTIVRALRMGKRREYLQQVLVNGGNVRQELLLNGAESGELASLFAGDLKAAATEAESVLSGGSLTAFEKMCDDALTEYLAAAKYESFGEKPLISYICAVETEISIVRIILNGKKAGLDQDTLRERLRETYV
jgi:V/A-type H+-transporting ATPase subunit C